ncbi:MAG TPA: hypothetical protein VHV51_00445 [Polyangiaceae bacterium]|jgi:hypothetical protein|nr:hypothetical protein [Polyangiaceae bacterium]
MIVQFERVIEQPIHDVALGDGSRWAALGDTPYVGDARGAHALPLPDALKPKPGEIDDARIFFGRDEEPRIMGARRASSAERSIYWRHAAGVWRDGREEIGALAASTQGALWGVLGSTDPELVCRVNAQCIIKRTSGWTTAPAGSSVLHVELCDGVLWGLDARGLSNMVTRGWVVALPAPAWSEPRGFWAASGEAWVATAHGLFRFHDRTWDEVAAPVAEPESIWASAANSVWVAGKSGAAHFDGRNWQSVALDGSFSKVLGRSAQELWFAGETGLFRVLP